MVKVIIIPGPIYGVAGSAVCSTIFLKLSSVHVIVARGATLICKLKLLRFYVLTVIIP